MRRFSANDLTEVLRRLLAADTRRPEIGEDAGPGADADVIDLGCEALRADCRE
jgi:hypothetical protein